MNRHAHAHRRALLAASSVLVASAVAAACTDRSESPSSTGLTSPPTASTSTSVPRTTTATTLPPPPAGSTWKLVFDDQFTGPRLDIGRWARCYPWAETTCTNANSSEEELYTPGNVTVSSGALVLTARRGAVTDPRLGSFGYTSGMVSTKRPGRTLFAFRYGYAQARMWLPTGGGLWSAFWLLDAHGNEQPEVDIAEARGQAPEVVSQYVHFVDAGGRRVFANQVAVPRANAGWHVYGVDWEPDALTWYVDGRKTWRMVYGPAIPRTDMILIANLAVGGDYARTPPPTTRFPAALRIDSVRVWQHS